MHYRRRLCPLLRRKLDNFKAQCFLLTCESRQVPVIDRLVWKTLVITTARSYLCLICILFENLDELTQLRLVMLCRRSMWHAQVVLLLAHQNWFVSRLHGGFHRTKGLLAGLHGRIKHLTFGHVQLILLGIFLDDFDVLFDKLAVRHCSRLLRRINYGDVVPVTELA